MCFFICMSICLRCYQKRMAICLILSTFLSFWLFLSSSLSSFTLLLKINYILIFEDSENHFRNRDFRFLCWSLLSKHDFIRFVHLFFTDSSTFIHTGSLMPFMERFFLIFCGRSKVVDYFHGTVIVHSDTISCGYMLIALHSCTLNCTVDKWLIKLGLL